MPNVETVIIEAIITNIQTKTVMILVIRSALKVQLGIKNIIDMDDQNNTNI